MAEIVDCHAHILSRDPARYPYSPITGHLPEWFDERAVDGEMLRARLDAAGVSKAVLVQFSTVHGYDNTYVVDTAAQHAGRFVGGCVIDATEPQVAETMSGWAERGVAGFRLTSADRVVAPDWVLVPAVWERTIELGLPLCVHFNLGNRAEGMPMLDQMLQRFGREAAVVLDHLGNPPFDEGPPLYGMGPLLDMARHERFSVKFSTVNLRRLAEARVEVEPVLRLLIERFGAHRIMWGSDSPNSPGDYGDLLGQMQHELVVFSQAEQDWIMGGTVTTVYPGLKGATA
jgi:L-fuconolactonase